MNNNFFVLTRYLRDRGFDARLLLLNNEFDHFHPSSDTFDNSYLEYLDVLPWGDLNSLETCTSQSVKRSLDSYDRIICCDRVPAFLHKAGVRADIFAPHGSDLFAYPFSGPFDRLLGRTRLVSAAKNQREGIRDIPHIFWGEKGNGMRGELSRMGVEKATTFVPLPMIYTPEFNPERIGTYENVSKYAAMFSMIRRENDIMVFHHARHFWHHKARTPWNQRKVKYHYKGTDKLIRAFARFVQDNPSVRSILVVFEYGIDVLHSKALIEQLGIANYVRWMPSMPRKEIMRGLSMADVGTGEFIGGWYSAGVVYENLALGKPLIHYCNVPDNDLYPFLNAHTEDEILAALQRYRDTPEEVKALGAQGAKWFQTRIIDRAMNAYADVLNGA